MDAEFEIDRAHRLLIDNIIYHTIHDAYCLGSGKYKNLLHERGGSNGKKEEARNETRAQRNAKELLEDLDTVEFKKYFGHFGWEHSEGKAFVAAMLKGERLDEGSQFLEKMKHAGRIYEHRGVAVIKARQEEARQDTGSSSQRSA